MPAGVAQAGKARRGPALDDFLNLTALQFDCNGSKTTATALAHRTLRRQGTHRKTINNGRRTGLGKSFVEIIVHPKCRKGVVGVGRDGCP